MSEETKTADNLLPARRFVDGFGQMIYWITVNRSDFDIPKFRSQLPVGVRELDDHVVSVAPRDELAGPYHVFFTWKLTGEKLLKFIIDYHAGPKKHESDEQEPFAEDMMRWFGQFIAIDAVDCHIHARLEYPREERQSTFPIALTAELPFQAETSGLTLRLPLKPSGVSSVRLNRGKSKWKAEVVADRLVSFVDSTPEVDASALIAVLDKFLEKRAT